MCVYVYVSFNNVCFVSWFLILELRIIEWMRVRARNTWLIFLLSLIFLILINWTTEEEKREKKETFLAFKSRQLKKEWKKDKNIAKEMYNVFDTIRLCGLYQFLMLLMNFLSFSSIYLSILTTTTTRENDTKFQYWFQNQSIIKNRLLEIKFFPNKKERSSEQLVII